MTVKSKSPASVDSVSQTRPKDFRPSVDDLSDARSRSGKILTSLRRLHRDAGIALKFGNPLELLVATILSAQCTDRRVNIVTKQLFENYHSADDYAAADVVELEQEIKSAGFYRNKARNIILSCSIIADKFDGVVPDNLAALVELPGVGRKTANVILGNVYGIAAIVTDTHVIRLSRLMGLSTNRDPVKLEFDLMELIPQRHWTQFSHLLIFHGRAVCLARKPCCGDCIVRKHCCYGRTGVADE